MSMRTYGEIDNVIFRRHGFDIYTNAVKYKLLGYDRNTFVSVNSMKELKEEITKFNTESGNG